MQTKTIVSDSTDIIRVTTLREGDAYRRLVKKVSYSDERTLALGIVTGLLNNGEEQVITATEVTLADGYQATPDIKQVVLSGDADLVLFPLTKDEYAEFFRQAKRAATRAVERATKEAAEKHSDLHAIEVLEDRLADGVLTMAEGHTIEQAPEGA